MSCDRKQYWCTLQTQDLLRHAVLCCLQGARKVHGLMDAFAVAEFLACFGTQSGAPHLDLLQLQAAVAWPLDGSELSDIYIALVKYLLAQWVS
jgi:hypothetical protein